MTTTVDRWVWTCTFFAEWQKTSKSIFNVEAASDPHMYYLFPHQGGDGPDSSPASKLWGTTADPDLSKVLLLNMVQISIPFE